jgi:hypothetical protein
MWDSVFWHLEIADMLDGTVVLSDLIVLLQDLIKGIAFVPKCSKGARIYKKMIGC